MSEILVPVDALSRHHAELSRRAAKEGVSRDVLEGEAGVALLHSMLFEKWPELLGALRAEMRLYNRYFWFTRFVALRSVQHGPDAGLDQQQFQILENAPFDLDFRLVQELETAARAVGPAHDSK